MVSDSELLIGTATYLGLQVSINYFSSKEMAVNWYGPTNMVSTSIWLCGIYLFLKRCKCTPIQEIKNVCIRSLLKMSFILITIELLVAARGVIENLVLQSMPDAANYIMSEYFGIGDFKALQWPFVVLLWIVSAYWAHIANNTDIFITYYLYGQVDFSVSRSTLGDGSILFDEETTATDPILYDEEITATDIPRYHRSKYTHTVSTIQLEPVH